MKIAVMGAGGIGSYLAALLARSGNDVAVVCRGSHLDAIRAGGLHVQKEGTTFRAPQLQATDDPTDVGVVDVVIVGVKLYALAHAAAQMAPMIGPQTMVVPIQNGVDAHEIIATALGSGHATGGTVFLSASLAEPGIVAARGATDRLIFGELDGEVSPRVLAFQQVCMAAGIDAIVSRAILRDMWEKFIVIAATSAVCCLARQSVGYVCADAALSALMLQGMQEAMSVAAALGIPVASDTDQKGLAFNRSVAYDTRVSMLEDIESGRPTELPWLSGHLVREAGFLDVPVPLHVVAHACLSPYSAGGHPVRH
jgi:2-dehydropantoate 2-reductase